MSTARKLNRKQNKINKSNTVNLDELLSNTVRLTAKSTVDTVTKIVLDILENDFGKLMKKDSRAERFNSLLADRFEALEKSELNAIVKDSINN